MQCAYVNLYGPQLLYSSGKFGQVFFMRSVHVHCTYMYMYIQHVHCTYMYIQHVRVQYMSKKQYFTGVTQYFCDTNSLTVPLTSNLTRSCESLASDSQLSREYVFVCARGRAGGLARTCWSAREEGLVVLRVRVCLLARKGWWSREYVFVCARGRAGGLASACLIPL